MFGMLLLSIVDTRHEIQLPPERSPFTYQGENKYKTIKLVFVWYIVRI